MKTSDTTTTVNGIDVALLGELAIEVHQSTEPVPLEVRTAHRWDSAARVEGNGGTITAFGETIDRAHHRLTSDLPRALGGADTAPAPTEVLLAALAGCVMSGLAEQAAFEGISLAEVHASLATTIDARGVFGVDGAPIAPEGITLTLTVAGDAEPQQLEALAHASLALSPTAAALTRPIPVRLEVRAR